MGRISLEAARGESGAVATFGFFIPGHLNKCVDSQRTEEKEVSQRNKGQTSSHLCLVLFCSLSHLVFMETSIGLLRTVRDLPRVTLLVNAGSQKLISGLPDPSTS